MSLLPSFASSSRTRLPQLVGPLISGRRSKADKSGSAGGTAKKVSGPPVDHGDGSTETLKRELYHPDRPSYTDRAPWQPRRADSVAALAAVLPPGQASEIHSTIAHASLVHRQQAGETHRLALKKKHDLLFAAAEELRLTYPGWYALASSGGPGESQDGTKNVLRPIEGSGRGRVEGMFPIEMRIPTETPGRDGWDYAWSADGGSSGAKAAGAGAKA